MITQKNIKNEKGITLIILVITIAIMIILAGATINLVVGEGGILDQVTQTEKVRNEQIAQSEVNTNNLIDQASEEMKEIWKDSSKANPPKLSEEMVPVKWNEEQKAWIVTNNKDSEWFDYSKKQWANVMLRDGLEVEGITNVATETLANMNGKKVTKVGSMFVWIPRYAYQIQSGYHSSTVGEINIEFMVGTTNMSVKGRTDWDNQSGEGNWNIHPAFEYSKTVEGIWVAKFEASHTNCTTDKSTGETNTDVTNLKLQVKPNVTSWRNITTGEMFTVCLNYKEELNSHMMKNTEWGAVAYLTQSIYGKNSEVGVNQCITYITGAGPNTGDNGVYAENYYEYNTSNFENTYSYITEQGQKASTTGNVYGIYDMSGGAWEHVAAYINNEKLQESSITKSTNMYEKDIYNVGNTDSSEDNYSANSNIYGDAIYEVSSVGTDYNSWNGNHSGFPNGTNYLFNRGGNGDSTGTRIGILSFAAVWEGKIARDTFRPVLSVF